VPLTLTWLFFIRWKHFISALSKSISSCTTFQICTRLVLGPRWALSAR
jgi:hypothetical protein